MNFIDGFNQQRNKMNYKDKLNEAYKTAFDNDDTADYSNRLLTKGIKSIENIKPEDIYYENDQVVTIKADTFEKAKVYGVRMWDPSVKEEWYDAMFNRYGYKDLFIIILKNDNPRLHEKYALAISHESAPELFDTNDQRIDVDKTLYDLGLDLEVFTGITKK